MVSTRKKEQQNRRLLSQLDDFDHDIIIGDAVNSGHQNGQVKEGTVDGEIIDNNGGDFSTTNENTVNVQTLERCFNEKVDREIGYIVDMAEDRTQNTIITAIDNLISTMFELAVTSLNASFGRDAARVTAISERGERIGVTASFQNVSKRNNTFLKLNANDESRGDIPDQVNCWSHEHIFTNNHTLITIAYLGF